MDFVASRKPRASNDRGFVAASILGRFVRHAQEFRERLDYMHLNPVRKGLVRQPYDWRWSSYNNFALDKEQVSRCPLQIDYVRLPQSYHG